MREEKRNRITVAITVNAVLFVFILIAIIIAQIVQIAILSNRKQQLQETYIALKAELDSNEELYDKINTDEKFYKWFLEYIDVYGDDDPLGVIPDGVIIK